MRFWFGFCLVVVACLVSTNSGHTIHTLYQDDMSFEEAVDNLEKLASLIEIEGNEIELSRFKRDDDDENRGVTILDVRNAILQLLDVVRDGNKNVERQEARGREISEQILQAVNENHGSSSTDKKINNISTFLIRMNGKLDSIERRLRRGGDASQDILQTLAQESFDILTIIPTYIENTKDAISKLSKATEEKFESVEHLLGGGPNAGANGNGQKSLTNVLQRTESRILEASNELKDIVVESGQMAESLFERVNDGYKDLTKEIRGLSNVERVLLDTADSVMDTKRKVEFGVQQIIYKVGELVKISGGEIDVQLKDQFEDITRTILSNQTTALANQENAMSTACMPLKDLA